MMKVQLASTKLKNWNLIKHINIGGNYMSNIEFIRNNICTNKQVFDNIKTTNCYAFALGLDINKDEFNKLLFNPGVISNSPTILSKHSAFEYDELIQNIINDFNELMIKFEEIDYKEISKNDEWKIAIYLKYYKYRCTNLITDCHFLREINGIWYHKSFNSYPTNLDSNNKIITDLESASIKDYEYKTCYKLKLR